MVQYSVAGAVGMNGQNKGRCVCEWERASAARDYLCPLISSLIIEALRKGVDVSDLSHAIAFPFGEKEWPGMESACHAAMEITRAAIEATQCHMQSAMENFPRQTCSICQTD